MEQINRQPQRARRPNGGDQAPRLGQVRHLGRGIKFKRDLEPKAPRRRAKSAQLIFAAGRVTIIAQHVHCPRPQRGSTGKRGVYVLPAVPATEAILRAAIGGWGVAAHVVADPSQRRAAFALATAAVTISGTSTLELGLAGVPMVVLETAQPVKFAETIQEALGRDPVRPKDFDGIENLPQRVEVVDASVDQVKAIIVRHC